MTYWATIDLFRGALVFRMLKSVSLGSFEWEKAYLLIFGLAASTL